jgi:hypothetical protein
MTRVVSDVIALRELLNVTRESIRRTFATSIDVLWRELHPGAQPSAKLHLELTRERFAEVVDQLARNASQVIGMLPIRLATTDAAELAAENVRQLAETMTYRSRVDDAPKALAAAVVDGDRNDVASGES